MYCSNNVEMIFHSLMMYCSLAVNHYLPLRIGKEMVWSSSETSESKCFSFLHLSKTKINQKKKLKQIRSPSLSFYFFCFVCSTAVSQLQSIFVLESPFIEIEKGMGKLHKNLVFLQSNLQHLCNTGMRWTLHLQNAWINHFY